MTPSPAAHQLAAAEQAFAAIEALDLEITAVRDRIGELLDSGRTDQELVFEFQDLVAQWIQLGERGERLSDQLWAVWIARHTAAFEGGGR